MFKVSVKDFALLASDVYEAASKYAKSSPNQSLGIANWMLMADEALLPTSYYSSFYARTYIVFYNDIASAAVIAYRGTKLNRFGNYIDDTELTANLTPSSLNLAYTYYSLATQFLEKHYSLTPKLTGHSLGGALAQLVAIKSQRSPETVVFNSPGIGQCLDHSFIEHQDFSYIHNVNSKDDVIHTVGKPVGVQIDLDMDASACDRAKLVTNLENQIMSSHPNIRNVLKPVIAVNDLPDAVLCKMEQHSINDLLQEINREPRVANEAF